MENDQPAPTSTQRSDAIRAVVDACLCGRLRGESLPDEALIAANADLMPELAEELSKLRLVEAARRAALDGPPDATRRAESRPDAPVSDPAHQDPKVIGAYRILERIGEGGMGLVYRAEQRHPVKRIVAVKVIKLGMDTKEVVARFEAERQALAMLAHPNVAKVFDAGTTEQGRPYFAMEYVPGVPLTDYCDRETLTTRERLELFIPVCQAVQHAHQKGIITRLFEFPTCRELATLHGFMLGAHSVSFSPDGKRLAVASNAKEAVKLWDIDSRQELLTLEGEGSILHRTAFSADGDAIGSLSEQGQLQIWRAPSWAQIEAAERIKLKEE